MKSKKAREFNPNTEKNRQLLISAIQGDEKACKKLKYIIGLPAEENEISEKEMREKAIETHLNNCPHLYDRNCDISENGMCQCRSGGKCKYMEQFIEELNN